MGCALILRCARGYTGAMPDAGLRELKKARTRRLIADTTARLFAERGYEQVAVSDVAREAEVAEQTVYNYFPTKEQLVIDRDQPVQDRLCDLIRSRPSGTTAAAAVRGAWDRRRPPEHPGPPGGPRRHGQARRTPSSTSARPSVRPRSSS